MKNIFNSIKFAAIFEDFKTQLPEIMGFIIYVILILINLTPKAEGSSITGYTNCLLVGKLFPDRRRCLQIMPIPTITDNWNTAQFTCKENGGFLTHYYTVRDRLHIINYARDKGVPTPLWVGLKKIGPDTTSEHSEMAWVIDHNTPVSDNTTLINYLLNPIVVWRPDLFQLSNTHFGDFDRKCGLLRIQPEELNKATFGHCTGADWEPKIPVCEFQQSNTPTATYTVKKWFSQKKSPFLPFLVLNGDESTCILACSKRFHCVGFNFSFSLQLCELIAGSAEDIREKDFIENLDFNYYERIASSGFTSY